MTERKITEAHYRPQTYLSAYTNKTRAEACAAAAEESGIVRVNWDDARWFAVQGVEVLETVVLYGSGRSEIEFRADSINPIVQKLARGPRFWR